MRKLKLIIGSIWAMIAVGLLLMTIVSFCWFYLLMTIGCAGVATIIFLEYLWTSDTTEYEERW